MRHKQIGKEICSLLPEEAGSDLESLRLTFQEKPVRRAGACMVQCKEVQKGTEQETEGMSI